MLLPLTLFLIRHDSPQRERVQRSCQCSQQVATAAQLQLTGLGLEDNSTISQQAKDALKAALPDCVVYF